MARTWGSVVVRAVAAAVLTLPVAAGPAAGDEHDDAYPPFAHLLADVTGDGRSDAVLDQPVYDSPLDRDVRVVDGRTGAVVWREVVPRLVEVDALGPGTPGILVVNTVDGGAADLYGRTLRVRAVDREVLWERTFEATDVVPNLFPTYARSAYRGVVGSPPLVLVQTDTRLETGIRRVTRTTATLLDPATGATVVEHEPFDTQQHAVRLVPLPGQDAFGVLLAPSAVATVGDGSLRAVAAATGRTLWTTPVRASRNTVVTELVAGTPPRPAFGVVSRYHDGAGLQLLDARTGAKLVDRPRGDDATPAGGAGAARRIRTVHFRKYGEPAGYQVDLVDLGGRVTGHAFFPLGTGTTFGTLSMGVSEAGDVDGDGWRDVLAHARVSGGGNPPAADDRLIDGRTLGSSVAPKNLQAMIVGAPGTAAVDGDGDDLYLASERGATVVDGRTRRPLLTIRGADFVGPLLTLREPGARCADVLAMSFRRNGYAVTRVAPDGRVRWSTEPGAVSVRDVSGPAGCSAASGPAERDASGAPRRPAAQVPAPPRRIPATGGLPPAILAAALLGAGALLRRRTAYRRLLGGGEARRSPGPRARLSSEVQATEEPLVTRALTLVGRARPRRERRPRHSPLTVPARLEPARRRSPS